MGTVNDITWMRTRAEGIMDRHGQVFDHMHQQLALGGDELGVALRGVGKSRMCYSVYAKERAAAGAECRRVD